MSHIIAKQLTIIYYILVCPNIIKELRKIELKHRDTKTKQRERMREVGKTKYGQ